MGDSFLLWGIKEKGGKKKIHLARIGVISDGVLFSPQLEKRTKKGAVSSGNLQFPDVALQPGVRFSWDVLAKKNSTCKEARFPIALSSSYL